MKQDDLQNSNSTRPGPPNYASRNVQYRLLVLVGSLLTVFFLMAEAAKPKNWEWMWKLDGGVEQPIQAEQPPIDDTTLPNPEPQVDRAEVAQDSFIAKPSQVADAALMNSREVNLKLLETVKDNTFFRSEESEAWFHLFAVLKNNPSEQLKASSSGPVSFVQLFRQTKEYRGKLVDVTGTVRRAFWVDAPANELEIDGYWQCFVKPDGSNSPFVVYSLELPEGFPEGMDLNEPIAVSGFCFKRWAYQAKGGPMVAPVVLAKDAEWIPLPPPPEKPPVPEGFLSRTLVVAVVAGFVLCGLVFAATNARPVRSLDQDRKNVDHVARSLADRRLPNPIDELREIEKHRKG